MVGGEGSTLSGKAPVLLPRFWTTPQRTSAAVHTKNEASSRSGFCVVVSPNQNQHCKQGVRKSEPRSSVSGADQNGLIGPGDPFEHTISNRHGR